MKSFKRLSKALAAGLLLLVSALSHSAPVTIMGDDLIFTYDDSTLFGTANVIGNSIFFLPTNFIAQAANDDGAVQVTDTVDIEIQVKEGSSYLMDNFQLFESGDYLLNGSSASADVNAFLQVTSFTHTCMMGGSPIPVACNMANTFDAGTLNVASGALEQWSLSGGLDLDMMPMWADDFHVNLRIQNTLDATSLDVGDSALIQKKFGAIGVEIVGEVPVPAAAWLFGSALLSLVVAKKRK